jgi:YHS domain-containing protein
VYLPCIGIVRDLTLGPRAARGATYNFINEEIYMQNAKKCPVCDWDINDGEIKVQAGGKEVTVCCDDCAKKVEENPAAYAAASK